MRQENKKLTRQVDALKTELQVSRTKLNNHFQFCPLRIKVEEDHSPVSPMSPSCTSSRITPSFYDDKCEQKFFPPSNSEEVSSTGLPDGQMHGECSPEPVDMNEYTRLSQIEPTLGPELATYGDINDYLNYM